MFYLCKKKIKLWFFQIYCKTEIQRCLLILVRTDNVTSIIKGLNFWQQIFKNKAKNNKNTNNIQNEDGLVKKKFQGGSVKSKEAKELFFKYVTVITKCRFSL